MMSISSLVVTIVLAFTGYLATYFYGLQLSKRKERLDLVDKRIKDFYGPLYISTEAGRISYETLLEKMGKSAVFDMDNPPTVDELAEWRIWSKSVFMPLNEYREKLILENAYIIHMTLNANLGPSKSIRKRFKISLPINPMSPNSSIEHP